jgi:LisH
LDVYIYDYLLKRNLQTTAKAFMSEGKVAADPVGKYIFYSFSLVWFIFYLHNFLFLLGILAFLEVGCLPNLLYSQFVQVTWCSIFSEICGNVLGFVLFLLGGSIIDGMMI